MKKDTATLVIATLVLAEVTIALIIAFRVYQQVQPTIAGLQGDYKGIGGLLNLITGKKPATTA